MHTQEHCGIGFTPLLTSTTPIFLINTLFFPPYDKCSIIQPSAFPLLHLSAPLCVIVCCYAQLSASELWCFGQSLSAFGCSEGNQLWQSCKLFLWRAGAHTSSPSPYLHQSAPMGPLSVRSARPQPGNINDHRKRRESERETQSGSGGRGTKERDPVGDSTKLLCVK